jgi:hypothetical protein
MNTKLVMTSSVLILGIAGISMTFMPYEILAGIHINPSKPLELVMQIIGALYFAFAMLNWMTKSSLIGGIYNRPVAVANFTHFLIVALAMIKAILATPGLSAAILAAAILYSIFAILFGIILFRHPIPESQNSGK